MPKNTAFFVVCGIGGLRQHFCHLLCHKAHGAHPVTRDNVGNHARIFAQKPRAYLMALRSASRDYTIGVWMRKLRTKESLSSLTRACLRCVDKGFGFHGASIHANVSLHCRSSSGKFMVHGSTLWICSMHTCYVFRA